MGYHSDGEPITFMTFNIRFDTPMDEPAGNRWPDRVESVIETIRRADPDILGIQEALSAQLRDLTAAFPDYRALGKPREVGLKGEYVPLLVHQGRFEIEEFGDFWLSATPDTEGSRGWDAGDPRHCTWARLTDGRTGRQFATFNTHLDRWGMRARFEAARLIVTRLALAPEAPAVVMGDFNALEQSEPLDALRGAGLRDTFRDAHPDEVDVQTIHHYTELKGPDKIDFILCGGRWDVLDADIVREPAAGRLPSDHYPVTARLRMRPTA